MLVIAFIGLIIIAFVFYVNDEQGSYVKESVDPFTVACGGRDYTAEFANNFTGNVFVIHASNWGWIDLALLDMDGDLSMNSFRRYCRYMDTDHKGKLHYCCRPR